MKHSFWSEFWSSRTICLYISIHSSGDGQLVTALKSSIDIYFVGKRTMVRSACFSGDTMRKPACVFCRQTNFYLALCLLYQRITQAPEESLWFGLLKMKAQEAKVSILLPNVLHICLLLHFISLIYFLLRTVMIIATQQISKCCFLLKFCYYFCF